MASEYLLNSTQHASGPDGLPESQFAGSTFSDFDARKYDAEPGIDHASYLKADHESFSEEDTWKVIGAFFNEHGLVHQQIESFNDFITYRMQEIIDAHPPIEIT